MIAGNVRLSGSTLLRTIFLFVAGFAIAVALLHFVVSDSLSLYGSDRSEKLEILRRSGFGYSSAIFGSSHAQQAFDPRVFDATLAGTPLGVRTLNMGIGGGSHPEQRLVALYFLKHLKPPPQGTPCLVLLEASAPSRFSLMFVSHPRQVNIMDWRSAEIAYDFALPPMNTTRYLHLREATFEPALYHSINLGMLSNRIFRPPYNDDLIEKETRDDQRGLYNPPPDQYSDADVKHGYARAFPVARAVPAHMEQGHTMIIEDLERAPNGDKVQFVWVAFPRLDDLRTYAVLPESQMTSRGEVPIIDLARPDLYPQLYERSLWLDSQHVNAEGAKVVSALLAKKLLEWAGTHPVRQNCGG